METKYLMVLFFSGMLAFATLTHADRHEANAAKHEVVQNTNNGNHKGWQNGQLLGLPQNSAERPFPVVNCRGDRHEEGTMDSQMQWL